MRLALALGIILSVGVCTSAAAQTATVPVVDSMREMKIGFLGNVIYDSNVAHSGAAEAAARGIVPQDEILEPSLNFNIVEPLGRQLLFLQGLAGYDYHIQNKQLNRQNDDLTGGGVVVTGPCRTTIYGHYLGVQTDIADLAGPTASDLLQTLGEGVSATCGTGHGFNGQLSYLHSDTTNSAAVQKQADHGGDSVSGNFGYQNATLGNLGVQASYSRQEFPNRPTANGTIGDGYDVETVGLSYQKTVGDRIKAAMVLGVQSLTRDSAPAGVPLTSKGLNYTADLDYNVSSRLEVLVHAQRAYEPSNRPGTLFQLLTTVNAMVNYKIGSRFTVTVGAIYEDSTSNQDAVAVSAVPTSFTQITGLGSITYRQSDRASWVLDLRQESKTTNLPAFDYTDDRATISLNVSF